MYYINEKAKSRLWSKCIPLAILRGALLDYVDGEY